MTAAIKEKIDHLRDLGKERDYCLSVLEMWAKVQDQGIDPENVESFGLDEGLLTATEKNSRYRLFRSGSVDPLVERLPNGGERLLRYNYVRLKDGTKVKLWPMIAAPPPDPAKDEP